MKTCPNRQVAYSVYKILVENSDKIVMPAGSTLVRIDRSGGSRPKSNAHTFSIIYIKQKKTPAKKTSALFFSDIHPLHTAIRMCRGDRTTSSSPSTPHSPSSSSSPSSYTPTTKMKRDLTPNTDTNTANTTRTTRLKWSR